jgi:lambda family phage portal protein
MAERRDKAPPLNWLDRLVGYFNPTAGLVRAVHRQSLTAMSSAGNAYHGASRKRRPLAGWKALSGDADSDTLQDLPDLRDRASDLVRNAPIAVGAISTQVNKVVGTGLALQVRPDASVLGLTEDQVDAWKRNVEPRFLAWAESEDCDATRRQNFYGLEALAFRAALERGDSFAVLKEIRRRNPNGLAVLVLEADRISNPHYRADKRTLAGGIEMDVNGAPLACYIEQLGTGALLHRASEWDRVAFYGERSQRRQVIHLYQRLRPGQTRGVPYLAPVIQVLKQIADYGESELEAAAVSALFAVFVTSDGAEQLSPLESATSGEYQASDTSAAGGGWDGKLSPGLAVELEPGQKIETTTPGRPNQAFEQFVTAWTRQVGIALDMPYEVLTKHFQSSYSAARAALMDMWSFTRVRREWLASNFCQPIYEEWLANEVAAGRIAAPGFFRDPLRRWAWSRAWWVGDGPGAIDPLKEAQAVEKNLAIGRTTLEKASMEYDGSDWRDNLRQRGREQTEAGGAGLLPAPAGQPPSADDDADPDEEDDIDQRRA